MTSIRPRWVASLSGAVEYFSSTGRVRNMQPTVGSMTSNRNKGRTSALRLMYRRMPLTIGVYPARKVAKPVWDSFACVLVDVVNPGNPLPAPGQHPLNQPDPPGEGRSLPRAESQGPLGHRPCTVMVRASRTKVSHTIVSSSPIRHNLNCHYCAQDSL